MRRYMLLITLVALSVLITGCPQPVTETVKQAIVIDAGSSGSRIYIYNISDGEFEGLPLVQSEIAAKKVEPGISEMDSQPEQVEQGLKELIEYAKQQIDEANWATTPVHLMATAGMRLETPAQQEATMAKVSEILAASPFDFKEALILSGQYEGLYAWIAINYLDDAFDPEQERESMLEMGGASTQIAYLNASVSPDMVKRAYRGQNYDIYAKSYLLMGQDQAFKLAQTPYCFPAGYEIDSVQVGTGDFAACALDIVEKYTSDCPNPGDPECVFGTDFQAPEIDSYLAISAFYYTFDFLKFEGEVTLNTLAEKATEYCSMSWEEVEKKYTGIDKKYLKTYCFYASYFWSLLSQGYELDEDLQILFSNKIDGEEPSWTWGAAVDLALGHKPQAYVNPQ